jgi:Zn-dependent protease
MGEREPHNWSLPLPGRLFGAIVRIHILFPCVALGIVLWVATSHEFAPGLWRQACVVMVMLFFCVLIHELAHVLAAIRAGGDAPSILIWPLGGLAFPDLPRTPRAWFRVALAGPAANLVMMAAAGGALAALGFVPPFNPLMSPINPHMYNWRDGKDYFSFANPGQSVSYYYRESDAKPMQEARLSFNRNTDGNYHLEYWPDEVDTPKDRSFKTGRPTRIETAKYVLEAQPLSGTRLSLAQFFLVNWFLLCINLLPAFPMDGARLFQAWRWRHGEFRHATATAAYVGFLVMLAIGVYAIAVNDILPAGLAAMIFIQCRHQLEMLERSEEDTTPLGYDFSEGFTSLEREDPPPPPPPKLTWLQRYRQRRLAARLLREQQEREAEERRLDELLDKILREGRQSLTDEELRFLTRVSNRYPNRK